MQIKRVKELLSERPVGAEIQVQGWVRNRRDSKGGFSFLDLNDGSALANLQVLAPATLPGYESVVLKLLTGACVIVRGTVVQSPGAKQSVELHATEVVLVGESGPDYPIQPKRHSFEFLREKAHLRPRTNTFGAVMRVRHTLAQAVHQYFAQNGFYYIHTPIITSSDCEGAGEMFRVTTLDALKPPRKPDGSCNWAEDFFGRETFLTVSGQLEAEVFATSLGRVYTFGPTFRAENSNTTRHLAEFWMIEPEMAFADLDLNAEVAEGFLKHVLKAALEQCEDDLVFLDKYAAEEPFLAALRQTVENPFARMNYTDAVEILQKSGKKFQYPAVWGQSLQTEHERFLTEEYLKKPLIVTDYPAQNTAFYMRLNDDGKTCRAMDVLVPQIGEIIGGSQREERYDVLLDRMKARGLDPETYWWYLELRKYGTVPHAGFGLGFERLVQFTTGMRNIRDVIPFPRTPKHADF